MTDTTITDATVFPQDDGTGVPSGNEDGNYAALFGALSRYQDGTYVDTGLGFSSIVTTDGSEEVTVTAGIAFVEDGNNVTNSERAGLPQFGQGASTDTFDTELPDAMPTIVVVPTDVTISLDSDATNDIYLAYDPTTNDSVYVRHGSGVSVPSDPNLKLGTVDSTGGSTTRASDDADITASSLDTPMLDVPDAGSVSVHDNLDIDTGKAIRDDSGISRYRILAGTTALNNQAGNRAINLNDGTVHRIDAYATTPVDIYDQEGGKTAVQYNTDPSSGVLEASNAGVRVQGNSDGIANTSGNAVEFWWDGGGYGRMQAYDRTNNAYKEMHYNASLHDFSDIGANLRLATDHFIQDGNGTKRMKLNSGRTLLYDEVGGALIALQSGSPNLVDMSVSATNLRIAEGQAIEDESGTSRFAIRSGRTIIKDGTGSNAFDLQSNNNKFYYNLLGNTVYFRDNTNSQNLITITEGSTGVLELTNADAHLKGNNIHGVSQIEGSNGNHRIRFDSNSDWIEFTDQSNNRQHLVAQNLFVDALGAWLSDNPVSDLNADMVDGKHASELSGADSGNIEAHNIVMTGGATQI